jgi:hypothetical protein
MGRVALTLHARAPNGGGLDGVAGGQIIAPQKEIAALREFSRPYVSFGSKAEKLDLSIRCPLYPPKADIERHDWHVRLVPIAS